MQKGYKKSISLILLLVVCVLFSPIVSYSVPALIDYPGVLMLPDSSAANGNYLMHFRIYDAETDGTLLYEEEQNVTVTNGIYHVILGSGTVMTGAMSPGLFSGDRWLEVVVGTAMAPRRPFSAVGFSVRSATTESIPDGSITANKIGEDCAVGQVLVKTASGWACGDAPYEP